jgi:hypothetical protein
MASFPTQFHHSENGVKTMLNLVAKGAVCTLLGVVAAASAPAAVRPSSSSSTPKIASVSKVTPAKLQTITVKGTGLGTHKAYTGASSNIMVLDTSTHPIWQASKLIVNKWTNSEIVLGGFAGDLTKSNFPLAKGNKIEIKVWNPQTGKGPATWKGTIE